MTRSEKEIALQKLNTIITNDVSLPLRSFASQVVPGEGNPDAQLFLVGEAPGKKEDESGRPFVGASGKLLDKMMETVNLKRSDVFIANLIKHRPPANRDPLPEEIAAYTPYLEKQLAIIQPNIIITLGRFSMAYFLGEGMAISNIHGQPQERDGRIIIPLYHPAAALYSGKLRPVLFEDFAKISSVIKTLKKEGRYNKTAKEKQANLL